MRWLPLATLIVPLAGAALADDATTTAATEAQDAGEFVLASGTHGSEPEMLFSVWQTHSVALARAEAEDASAEELQTLQLASAAAAEAYEASLIAQNTMLLAAAGPELLSDDLQAEFQTISHE